MTYIGIIDDHQIFREGVQSLVLQSGNREILLSSNTLNSCSDEVLSKLDILILDLNLGSQNGMSLIKPLKTKFPSLKIIILSMMEKEIYEKQALGLSADFYVNKGEAYESLVNILDELEGKVVGQQTKVVSQDDAWSEILGGLSKREADVLNLMLAGKTQKEISFDLNLSVKTVSTYKRRLMQKLKVSNDLELFSLYNSLKN